MGNGLLHRPQQKILRQPGGGWRWTFRWPRVQVRTVTRGHKEAGMRPPAKPQKGRLKYKHGPGRGFWNPDCKRSNAWYRKEGAGRQSLFRFASISGTS